MSMCYLCLFPTSTRSVHLQKKDMDNQPKVVDYAGSNCRINRITKPTAKWDGKGLHFHDIVRKELRSHKVTSFIG